MTTHNTLGDVSRLLRALGNSSSSYAVEIHFDGKTWVIRRDATDASISFNVLDDAEQRAAELARAEGDDEVLVYDLEGTLLDRFPIAGDREGLVEMIQTRYAKPRATTERELERFFASLLR